MKKSKELRSVKDYISNLTKKVFDKVPQEASNNRMSVGFLGGSGVKKYLWQPHNYRLYFDFSRVSFNRPNRPLKFLHKKLEGRLSKFHFKGFEYKTKNYGSEHIFLNFNFCNITVKKNMVEVVNKTHDKQWRLIEASSLKDIDDKIRMVTAEMDEHCVDTLKLFIEFFGGRSSFKVLNRYCENGIHGDDFLDRVPAEMVIHDTNFKKVYKEKVELYGTSSVKNYISNRTVEDVAPEIIKEVRINRKVVKDAMKDILEISLSSAKLNHSTAELGRSTAEVAAGSSKVMDDFVKTFLPVHYQHAVNIKTHTRVLKDISKSFVKFNRLLSSKQKKLGDFGE